MAEEEFFSLKDVATMLKVSEQTVRRWVKSGQLKAYKPGLEYRIPSGDLQEFLESRSPKAVAPTLSEPDEVSDEERRETLQQYREGLMNAHSRLDALRGEWVGDREALGDLAIIADVFSLGAWVLVKDELEEHTEEAITSRVPGALARIDDLAEDIHQSLEAASDMSEFVKRRRRQIEAAS